MRKKLLLMLLIMNLFLAGCWDQHELVNKTFVNGVGFDLSEDGKIQATVRALNIKGTGGGRFEVEDELINAERSSTVGLAFDIDSMVAGEVDFSQAHILLIGDEMAQNGINQLLEPFYRGRGSNLTQKIAITKGKAETFISTEKEKSPIAFFILQEIEGAEQSTYLPTENLLTIWTKIQTPGKDFILPYLEVVEERIGIAGVALFNGDKFSGETFSREQSNLLLLMLDQLKVTNRMALILNQGEEELSISFSTLKMKRDMKVLVDKTTNQINCTIDINLQIEVNSYPQNFKEELNIKKLQKDLSEELTKQAKEIITTLLKANCDVFGIGLKVSNKHPDLWNKLDWNEEYKNIQIEPKVNVKILKTGNLY